MRAAILLACLVPLSAGLAGALLGPRLLGGDAAALSSHLRYLSGLLLGVGVVFAWCALDLRRRGAVFDALAFVVVLGGLARLFGAALEGWPPAPHLAALGMELVVTPLLWLWSRRARR